MGGLGNPVVMHSGGFMQSRSHARLAFQRDSFASRLKCRNLKYLSLTVCWLLHVKCAISRVGYTAGQNGVLRYKERNQRKRSGEIEWGREGRQRVGEEGGRRDRQTDRDREIDRHTETDKQTDRETGRETERERVNIVYANNNKIQLHKTLTNY